MSRLRIATCFDACRLASALLLAVLLGLPQAGADTEVGGYILEDTTRTTADSPYVVVESLIVAGGATLTVEPGVAEPGDWASIRFTDYAADAVYDENGEYLSGSVLEHVIVEYAGDRRAAVRATQSAPYLVRCKIRHNAHFGLRVGGVDAPALRV